MPVKGLWGTAGEFFIACLFLCTNFRHFTFEEHLFSHGIHLMLVLAGAWVLWILPGFRGNAWGEKNLQERGYEFVFPVEAEAPDAAMNAAIATMRGGSAIYRSSARKGGKAMKRICMGLIVIAFVFVTSSLAGAEMNGHFILDGWKAFQQPETKDRRLSDMYNEGIFTGFVIGVCDGILKLPPGVTTAQRLNAVGKYLDNHPERLHEAAVLLVVDALNEAFPKSPAKWK